MIVCKLCSYMRKKSQAVAISFLSHLPASVSDIPSLVAALLHFEFRFHHCECCEFHIFGNKNITVGISIISYLQAEIWEFVDWLSLFWISDFRSNNTVFVLLYIWVSNLRKHRYSHWNFNSISSTNWDITFFWLGSHRIQVLTSACIVPS